MKSLNSFPSPRNSPSRSIAFFSFLALGLCATSVTSVEAQSRKQRVPVAPSTIECGTSVELRITSMEATQGSLLLVEVRSAKPLASVKAEWNGAQLSFWESHQGQDLGTDIHRSLLGVDLEQAPGKYPLVITAQIADGAAVNCSETLTVTAGKFPTEKLQVSKEFVEPDPEQLARAKAESQKLRDIYAITTPVRLWQGRFRLPLDGVTTGGNFGRRRVLNGQPGSPHTGVDFPSPTGTPIHAAQRGRVVIAEPFFFSGNTVLIDHGLGIYTLYGHLSKIDVKVGDLLDSGAVLGEVGATGRVTGPHLHWGLTVNRAKVNSLQIVKLLGVR